MRGRLALILAEPGDRLGERVGLALLGRGCRVLQASGMDLAQARWVHRLDERTRTLVQFPDGRVLDDTQIGVVLNRLDGVVLPQFAHAAAADRDYAAAEFCALRVSWLNGLAVRVSNPPGAEGAWAASLHPLGWHALASAHGLAVGDFLVTSSLRGGHCFGLERVGASAYPHGSDVAGWYRSRFAADELRWLWVFGDGWTGPVDESLAARCPAFVRALGLHYAALGFAPSGKGLRLVEVDPCPPADDETIAECCAAWLQADLLATSGAVA